MKSISSISSLLISVVICLSALCVNAETLSTGLKAELTQCGKIKDNLMRLACFDNLIKTPATSLPAINKASADVKVKKANTTVINKDDAFGAEHLKRAKSNTEDEQVIFIVKKIKKDPHGKWRFTFTNNQYWKQTDSNYFRVKVGDSVILKKGVFGAFYMKKNAPNSNRSIRVKRAK